MIYSISWRKFLFSNAFSWTYCQKRIEPSARLQTPIECHTWILILFVVVQVVQFEYCVIVGVDFEVFIVYSFLFFAFKSVAILFIVWNGPKYVKNEIESICNFPAQTIISCNLNEIEYLIVTYEISNDFPYWVSLLNCYGAFLNY